MHKHKIRKQPDEETGAKYRDPVCGMEVSNTDRALFYEFKGDRYYFCSRNCRERFAADPEKYLNPESDASETEGRIYTCPMHPEVQPGKEQRTPFGCCDRCRGR